jgi:hypothetical protein
MVKRSARLWPGNGENGRTQAQDIAIQYRPNSICCKWSGQVSSMRIVIDKGEAG